MSISSNKVMGKIFWPSPLNFQDSFCIMPPACPLWQSTGCFNGRQQQWFPFSLVPPPAMTLPCQGVLGTPQGHPRAQIHILTPAVAAMRSSRTDQEPKPTQDMTPKAQRSEGKGIAGCIWHPSECKHGPEKQEDVLVGEGREPGTKITVPQVPVMLRCMCLGFTGHSREMLPPSLWGVIISMKWLSRKKDLRMHFRIVGNLLSLKLGQRQ